MTYVLSQWWMDVHFKGKQLSTRSHADLWNTELLAFESGVLRTSAQSLCVIHDPNSRILESGALCSFVLLSVCLLGIPLVPRGAADGHYCLEVGVMLDFYKHIFCFDFV